MRRWSTLAFVLSCAVPVLWPSALLSQTRAPKPDSKYDRQIKEYLKRVKPSPVLEGGWVIETPSHVLHSTVSKEYAAAAAVHLLRFDRAFRAIFQGEYKDKRKPVAYAFATEKEYLQFSPEAKGTLGRFLCKEDRGEKKLIKDLAWFSIPPLEKDFYKTDFSVVQHEATHQLLDAYTDNQRIPKWFHEGCATFFESWDLDRRNEENILSGLKGHYALGISLTYPHQTPAPLLKDFWIEPRKLLNLDDSFQKPVLVAPPPKKKELDFAAQMRLQEEYNESWCALTFFVDHKKGQEIFKLFIKRFREGAGLPQIRKDYYTEVFLSSFEEEWRKFIEKKVLVKWDLPTVGGQKLRVGSIEAPPPGTKGYPLTRDRRGDMFLVAAETRTLTVSGKECKVSMLKAWSGPLSFYEEAWRAAPLLLSHGKAALVGGLYGLAVLGDPGERGPLALILMPAWSRLSKEDSEALGARLSEAAARLLEGSK